MKNTPDGYMNGQDGKKSKSLSCKGENKGRFGGKKKDMNKKALVIATILVVTGVSTVYAADLNITGSFDPDPGAASAELWNTTFTWGSLGANANLTNSSQLNNTGSVNIDSTIYNDTYSGDMTLVDEVDLDAQDEFACIFNSADSSWIDMGSVGSVAVLDTNLAASGTSDFTVCILGPPSFSANHGSQTFNLVVAYETHS